MTWVHRVSLLGMLGILLAGCQPKPKRPIDREASFRAASSQSTVAVAVPALPAVMRPTLALYDADCVRRAQVEIFRVQGAQEVDTCRGALVAQTETGSVLLTAAHCLTVSNHGRKPITNELKSSARVRAPGSGPDSVPILRQWIHPRFQRGIPGSPYDLALIMTDGRLEGAVAPLRQLLSGGHRPSKLSLAAPTGRIVEVRTQDARNLRVTVQGDKRFLCRGSSGAPLYARGKGDAEGSFFLAAVVGSGPRTCSGSAGASFSAPIVPSMIESFAMNRNVDLPSESCTQCLERVGASGQRCQTSYRRCFETTECRDRALGAENATVTPLEEWATLLNCGVSNSCSLCRDP